jgi:hypothetical protein
MQRVISVLITIKKQKKITYSYKVSQSNHSLVILYDLNFFFGVGRLCIDNHKLKSYKYTVTDTNTLINFIIPHFDKYPLVGSKLLDFLD